MARPARQRTDPEETRARIIETAEEQFRRVGYAKTTVADIAAALAMSPANVYRFFPSKAAINEAICSRCVRDIEERAWAVVRMKASAAERLERLALEVHRFNKANFTNERRIHDMVAAAFEENWEAIKGHIGRLTTIIEALIRDGIDRGEFAVEDPASAARCVHAGFVRFWNPQMIAQCPSDDIESEAREVARFMARALAKPN